MQKQLDNERTGGGVKHMDGLGLTRADEMSSNSKSESNSSAPPRTSPVEAAGAELDGAAAACDATAASGLMIGAVELLRVEGAAAG